MKTLSQIKSDNIFNEINNLFNTGYQFQTLLEEQNVLNLIKQGLQAAKNINDKEKTKELSALLMMLL